MYKIEPPLAVGESEINSNNSVFLITRFSHNRRVSKRAVFGQNIFKDFIIPTRTTSLN